VGLTTADGLRLEAQLHPAADPHAAVVLAHPHPANGGDMHSGIIGWLYEALPTRGVVTLRLNFRGVGASEGRHEGGVGERLDLQAAVDAVRAAGPELPVVLVGWSFGVDREGEVDAPGVAGWCALAPNFRSVGADAMAAGRDDRPVLLMVPEHDQVCPPASARAEVAAWNGGRVALTVLGGTDHFLAGAAGDITDAVVAFTHTAATGA